MRPPEVIKRALAAFGDVAKTRAGMISGGIVALGAVVVAVVQRRHSRPIELPDPGAFAVETALSVRNAAKSTVIAAVREADETDGRLIAETVADAMAEGARSGADLIAVAVGVVEGAIQVGHLVGMESDEAAGLAASSAVDAATAQGAVAGERVRELLEPHVTLRT